MTLPATLNELLDQNAEKLEVPESITKLLAKPPKGVDIAAIKKHYGIVDEPVVPPMPAAVEPPADAVDPRKPEEQAPKKRKTRADKGKPRTKKPAADPGDAAAIAGVCAAAGLPAQEARLYIQLLTELAE